MSGVTAILFDVIPGWFRLSGNPGFHWFETEPVEGAEPACKLLSVTKGDTPLPMSEPDPKAGLVEITNMLCTSCYSVAEKR